MITEQLSQHLVLSCFYSVLYWYKSGDKVIRYRGGKCL